LQASRIGDELYSHIIISIGEEETKRATDENDQSERERNTFLDTDARKSLDDKPQFITGNLPKFEHQKALVYSQLLSDIERIEDPKDKNQAFQYLRVALKNAFPLLKESTAILAEEITQLKLSASIQRDTVDTHKAKVTKQTQLIKDSSNDEASV
jgi:hypothetical protein